MPRKLITINNPLLIDGVNEQANDDIYSIELEDIIVGCIRSFDSTSNQAFVNHIKVLKLLKELDVFTVPAVMGSLRCSKAQASRYIQVLTLCEPFLARWIARGTKLRGYLEITPNQITGGLLPVYLAKKERNHAKEIKTEP